MTHIPGSSYGVLVRAWAGSELVVDLPLGHGQDPVVVLNRLGWRVERPLSATREGGVIEVAFAVRASAPCAPPPRLLDARPLAVAVTGVDRERGLVVAAGEKPVPRQRVSAAVLIVTQVPAGTFDSTGEPGPGGLCVLATRYSGAALRWDGMWGLPGGGVDPAEQPAAAARREAAEETGQDVHVAELALVQSAHWIGRAPTGVVEDFHAVRLIYRGECPAPGPVVVHDAGGTTSQAAWVPVDRAPEWPWAPGARVQLETLGVLPAS